MKQKPWKTYAFWIFLTEAVGALSGWLTSGAMKDYAAIRPSFSPPGFVFPIVWTILFALMGVGAARIDLSDPSKARSCGLKIYFVQLLVNFFWGPIFFQMQAYGFALIWLCILWILILWMILTFRKVDKTAARLQISYLLWVTFAGYLNAAVWFLNR